MSKVVFEHECHVDMYQHYRDVYGARKGQRIFFAKAILRRLSKIPGCRIVRISDEEFRVKGSKKEKSHEDNAERSSEYRGSFGKTRSGTRQSWSLSEANINGWPKAMVKAAGLSLAQEVENPFGKDGIEILLTMRYRIHNNIRVVRKHCQTKSVFNKTRIAMEAHRHVKHLLRIHRRDKAAAKT